MFWPHFLRRAWSLARSQGYPWQLGTSSQRGFMRGLDLARAQGVKWPQLELSWPQQRTLFHLGITLKLLLAVWQTIQSSIQQLLSHHPYCVPGAVLSTYYLGFHLVFLTTLHGRLYSSHVTNEQSAARGILCSLWKVKNRSQDLYAGSVAPESGGLGSKEPGPLPGS